MLGLLSLVNYLGHKVGRGSCSFVLSNNAMEVSGDRFLNVVQCAKGVPYPFTLVPLREVSPTILLPYEEEIMFLLLQLGLPLNRKHKTLSISETIPSDLSHSAPSSQ